MLPAPEACSPTVELPGTIFGGVAFSLDETVEFPLPGDSGLTRLASAPVCSGPVRFVSRGGTAKPVLAGSPGISLAEFGAAFGAAFEFALALGAAFVAAFCGEAGPLGGMVSDSSNFGIDCDDSRSSLGASVFGPIGLISGPIMEEIFDRSLPDAIVCVAVSSSSSLTEVLRAVTGSPSACSWSEVSVSNDLLAWDGCAAAF